MSRFLLIRHGSCDPLGKFLAGRMPGVRLNEAGKSEAAALAERLRETEIHMLYSSPLERAYETAEAIGAAKDLPIEISESFQEIDCGDWTGRTFEELTGDQQWKFFNEYRKGARIPGGELIAEVQMRMVVEMERLRKQFPTETIAIVSHADPLRAALCYYCGIPLDLMLRLTIAPASVSVLTCTDYGAQLERLNSLFHIS